MRSVAPLTTIVLTGLLTINSAQADYDGPEVAHEFSTKRPDTLKVCEQERFNTSLDVYKMCTKAQQAAEGFAEQFAGQEGAIQGYLRGYTWGLYRGTTVTRDSERWMTVGAQEVDTLSQYWKPAMTEGANVGTQKGSEAAKAEVIQRFKKAVDTTSFPSSSFSVPSSNYEPKSDAYITFVRKDSPIPTAETLLNSEEFQQDLPIFASFEGLAFIERNTTPQAFWYGNNTDTSVNEPGVYALDTEVWSSMSRAFTLWKNHPSFTEDVAVYSRFVTTEERTGTPADEGTLDDTKLGLLMSDLYEVVFQLNYEHWANYYFSQAFQQQLNNGQLAGERLGEDIGSQIAIERGLEKAFNERFISEGRSAHQESYHEAYTNTFYDTYDDYAKNPHLELKIERVIGTVDDGIIQPGEPIQLEYSITNIGGVSAPVSPSVSGSIQNGNTQKADSIAGLTSEQRTTQVIATIDPRLNPRDKATIKLSIDKDTHASIEQVVNNLVEIVATEININALTGAGQIVLTAKNLTTKPTTGEVSATLTIDEQSISVAVGKISAGKTKKLRLDVNNLNPLTIIDGKQQGSVVLYHKNDALDTQSVDIRSKAPAADLVQYFDQIVNGKGVFPAGITMPDHIDATIALIVAKNRVQVTQYVNGNGKNMYKKHPEQTYVGMLSATFSSHEQNEFSINAYDRLAQQLIKESTQFNPFLGLSPKRKHYRKLVRSYSKNKRIK